VAKSLDVDDLEKILQNRGGGPVPVPVPVPVPSEWPDAYEEEGSPSQGRAGSIEALSPTQKLSLLKRSVSRSPTKQRQGQGSPLKDGPGPFPHQITGTGHAPTPSTSNAGSVGGSALSRRLAQKNDGRAVPMFERPTLPHPHSTTLEAPAAPSFASSSSSSSSARQVYDINNELAAFFDPTSTADKGRYRVQDARSFVTDSLHRKPDLVHEGVTLLCGVRKEVRGAERADGGSGVGGRKEEVITVLFDRSEFSEKRAREWWLANRDRLL
jgi:hypothetical protein